MTALLVRQIPLAEADRDLRQGRWTYWAGAPDRVHDEIAGKTIGLLGFGHIGKAIAPRAKAFEMRVMSPTAAPSRPRTWSTRPTRSRSSPPSAARPMPMSSRCR